MRKSAALEIVLELSTESSVKFFMHKWLKVLQIKSHLGPTKIQHYTLAYNLTNMYMLFDEIVRYVEHDEDC